MSARSYPNRELKQALKDVEARLARRERVLPEDLDAVRTLAAGLEPLPPALARRLSQVTATSALRNRGVPEPVLEGLYEDVRSATQDERWSRARVTNAFLEAPHSLTLWRRTATAACVLVAVSVGWVLTRSPEVTSARPLSQVERYSLLDGVLERYDAAVENTGGRSAAGSLNVYEVGTGFTPGVSALPPRFESRHQPFSVWGFGSGSVRVEIRQRGGPLRLPPAEANSGEIERN